MRQRTSENGQILNENETEAQNASNTRADPADITKTHYNYSLISKEDMVFESDTDFLLEK